MIQQYLAHGWSLLPVVARGKTPAQKWAHAQHERADMADVYTWLENGLNLGIATGKLSGVVVVDCDSAAAVARVSELGHPPTPTVLTGRGAHLYFKWTDGIRNRAAVEPGIDMRGEGGFAVLPPSVHENGEEYRWASGLSLGDVAPAELPAWALRAQKGLQNGREPGEWGALFGEFLQEGGRNHRLAELSGYLLRKWVEPDVVEALMIAWNDRCCHPPMPRGEVRRTVQSIAARDARRRANA